VPGSSGADVFLSDGTQFNRVGSWTGHGHGTDGWYIGDFNGDGKDDIFRYVPGSSGADVFLSDGTQFNRVGSWTGAGHGTDGWYVGDFNGDGKDDIFRYVPGTSGADVFLSNGTNSFIHSGSWTGSGNGTDGWYVGDFNGDAKDDIFRYVPGSSGAEVFLADSLGLVASFPISKTSHLGFDDDMMRDMKGERETDMSYMEEEEFLVPFREQARTGELPSIFVIKSAYEEKIGKAVRTVTIRQLLHRHGYWDYVERFNKVREVRGFKKTKKKN
jgi:hypothetical protein